MTRITPCAGLDGLGDFPPELTVVATNDMGDPLAVDAAGRVWELPHGNGHWHERSLAFATMQQLHAHVAFQDRFDVPDGADLAALRARKQAVEQFLKDQRGAPCSREAAKEAIADLRDAIEDARFRQSKQGRNLTARHEVGRRCEQALHDAGAPGEWMIRPHVDQDGALLAVGTYDAPWTEAKVLDLLRPLLGGYELLFRAWPQPPAG